ncbi:hypothetical protein BGZ95_005821, partial [Linnemannia exigua]
GLNNIKFMRDVGMGPVPPEYIDYFIGSTVNIYNPSQLTLNIGTLKLEAGLKGWEESDWLGTAVIKNLRLVPGDNYVLSELTTSMQHPKGLEFVLNMATEDQMLTMRASSTSTSNPALNTGLKTLRNGVIVPKGLEVPKQPAYSNVWNIKILPTTKDDGLVEVSTVFQSPYYMDMEVEGLCSSVAECELNPYPSVLSVYNSAGASSNLLTFPYDLTYSVKANGSTPHAFKMSLFNNSPSLAKIDEFIALSTAKGEIPMEVVLSPKVRLGGVPTVVVSAWYEGSSYPGHLTLKTGPDFPTIRDWYVKQTTPVAPPPPVTSALPSPPATPSPSPSPSSSPSPSPVAPSPVVSPPVVSPSPVVAPAA